jgi:hypothetical protein
MPHAHDHDQRDRAAESWQRKLDTIRFYGPHAVWKIGGLRLLDQTCTNRTGRQEEDGCRPDWTQ